MRQPDPGVRVGWRPTRNNYFPWAAQVDGVWWVLRLNNFPDHPLYTLFVNGNESRFDVDDFPPRWRKRKLALPRRLVDNVLEPIIDLRAYGSEIGKPCDNGFCCE